MTTTAHDIVMMLRRHYLPPSRPAPGIFAAEIESPDGRRRADAIWVPMTRSGEHGIVGHEIKVSRSDVLAELEDPTKADAWSRYCTRWWLVVSDPALVDGLGALDVPDTWGILAPPSGRRTRTMTVVKAAPKLKPIDPGEAYHRILGWHYYGARERIETLERAKRFADERADRDHQRITMLEANAGNRGGRLDEIVADVVAALHGRDDVYVGDVDPSKIAAAIADLAQVESAKRSVLQSLANLERDFERIHRDLTEPFGWGKHQVAKARARLEKGSAE